MATTAWMRARAATFDTITATTIKNTKPATLPGSATVNVKIGGMKKKLEQSDDTTLASSEGHKPRRTATPTTAVRNTRSTFWIANHAWMSSPMPSAAATAASDSA